MTYEIAQATLTALINVTAIAGITGIIAHALYTRHTRWMRTYCPAIADYTPDTRVEVETLAPVTEPQSEPQPQNQPELEDEDTWETPVSSSPARYWVRQPQPIKPALMLIPALEETQQPTFQNYSESRLRRIAKEMKIKRYSVLSRAQLMTEISKHPAAIKFA